MSSFSVENPWMKERESILCGWKPDYNRGKINNMNMNLSVDWYSFSNRQLRDYVKMIKACGFTGIQISDDCSHWRWFNNYEICHDKMKVFAQALRDEGMKVTLWVWAATFTGYGWVDETAVYTPKNGGKAYDDPDVFATFNKYYDIYADFAPYADKLILHFFDPGYLTDLDDVIRFTKLIESKFRAINPDILLGVDTWSCPEQFPQKLIEAGLGDAMLMEVNSWEREQRRAFRQGVKQLGLNLGEWSWYLADMEIDQSAWMVVNAKVEKEVYNRIRNDGDDIMVPSYWSEMDSYHVMNVFSLYCAGHLLINPEEDPDKLVRDVAYAIYGEKHGAAAEYALQLIQDGRSGSTWEEYWWPHPTRYKPLFDPEKIYARAQKAFALMQTVAADGDICTDFPLPISPTAIARLMLPHLEQIRDFAKFYLDFEQLEQQAQAVSSKEELYMLVDKLWNPVYEYNTIVGVWGQREARAQATTVYIFCQSHGIPMPKKPLYYYQLKKRYYEYLVSDAKSENSDTLWRHAYEANLPFYFYEDEILADLETEGLIQQLPGEKIHINFFEAYKYH